MPNDTDKKPGVAAKPPSCFYRIGEAEFGPEPADSLLRKLLAAEITLDTPVRPEDEAAFRPLAELPYFRRELPLFRTRLELLLKKRRSFRFAYLMLFMSAAWLLGCFLFRREG